MVREEGNKESVATTTCLTLQNQEEGRKETKWKEQPETLKTGLRLHQSEI
jgi:hypothetical protein